MDKKIRQSNYVPILFGKTAVAFSKEKGQWLLANVDQGIGWPQKKVMVIYRGCKILLLPATKNFHATAAVITKGNALKEGKIFLMNFLSALSWYHPGKIDVIKWTNSSQDAALTNHLRLPLIKSAGMTRLFFRPTELPNPKDPKAQLALALFREGLSLNHLGYSFLSYYKIINLGYPNGEKQKKWIRRSLPLIENLPHLKDRFKQIKAQYADPVAYIYEACRCAVAHASMKQTTYNPESIEDEIRFYEVQPIVHALAKLIIENEFGIKSISTVLREHRYELEGFCQLLDEKILAKLKSGEPLSLSDFQLNTNISLRLWNHKKFKAFEKLKITVTSIYNGVVTLNLSRDNIIKIPLVLDFPNEKLVFDPTKDIDFEDDGTKNAALQLVDAYQFCNKMIGNAVLEVWETNTNIILGRLLEYIPKKIMPHIVDALCKEQVTQWQEEAKKRGTVKNK